MSWNRWGLGLFFLTSRGDILSLLAFSGGCYKSRCPTFALPYVAQKLPERDPLFATSRYLIGGWIFDDYGPADEELGTWELEHEPCWRANEPWPFGGIGRHKCRNPFGWGLLRKSRCWFAGGGDFRCGRSVRLSNARCCSLRGHACGPGCKGLHGLTECRGRPLWRWWFRRRRPTDLGFMPGHKYLLMTAVRAADMASRCWEGCGIHHKTGCTVEASQLHAIVHPQPVKV